MYTGLHNLSEKKQNEVIASYSFLLQLPMYVNLEKKYKEAKKTIRDQRNMIECLHRQNIDILEKYARTNSGELRSLSPEGDKFPRIPSDSASATQAEYFTNSDRRSPSTSDSHRFTESTGLSKICGGEAVVNSYELRSPEFQGVAESEGRSKSAIFGRDAVSYENPRTPSSARPEYFTNSETFSRIKVEKGFQSKSRITDLIVPKMTTVITIDSDDETKTHETETQTEQDVAQEEEEDVEVEATEEEEEVEVEVEVEVEEEVETTEEEEVEVETTEEEEEVEVETTEEEEEVEVETTEEEEEEVEVETTEEEEEVEVETQGFTESEGRSKSAIFGRDEVSYENTEEEEEGVYEVEINGKRYYTTNDTNGTIYAILDDDDIGDEIGTFVNGNAVFR
jgi:hypothetical protein